MKPRYAPLRKSVNITNSRWLAYATASAASALACAPPAEGTIHYSGLINQKFMIALPDIATFQLDQPGDFIRLIHSTGTAYAGYNYFGVAGRAGASIAGFYTDKCPGNSAWASNLESGQLISRRPFVPAQSALLDIHGNCGQFIRGGVGYIGFKFNSGSGDQYGWARIVTGRPFYGTFILRDYAYGDVGDQVRAGDKGDELITDQGSLGWLALGAAGLVSWRLRRRVVHA